MKKNNTLITGEVIEQGMEPITNEEYCEETVRLFLQTQLGHLALAQRLYEIKTKKLYHPQWSSMTEFIMELNDLGISTVSRLIGLHEKIVLGAGIPRDEIGEAGWSKVAIALPLIHTADEAHHWVDKAKLLTKADFAKEVKEARTGKLMKDCEHTKAYLLRICPDCGDKWREIDVTTINNQAVVNALGSVGIEVNEVQVEKIIESLAEQGYKHDPEQE